MQFQKMTTRAALAGGLAIALVFTVHAARTPAPAGDTAGNLAGGSAGLKSAGALAFGPDGMLFVGDSVGGAIAAIDTGDRTPSAASTIDVRAIDEKLAALVGVMPGDILINDVVVNPLSKNVYVCSWYASTRRVR